MDQSLYIGYMRVSTQDQKFDLQRDALIAAGCLEENIYSDKMSGAKDDRPGLQAALDFLRKGDTLVVWKLDRLGRTMPKLVDLLNELNDKGVQFKCLNPDMDTSTPMGKAMYYLSGIFAEMERDLIRERIIAGMEAAKDRGTKFGPKFKLSNSQMEMLYKLHEANTPISELVKQFGITKKTVYNYIGRWEEMQLEKGGS